MRSEHVVALIFTLNLYTCFFLLFLFVLSSVFKRLFLPLLLFVKPFFNVKNFFVFNLRFVPQEETKKL